MATKPKLLDVCCSAGLLSEGYADRFDVVGVDIDPQPHYPYEFMQADLRDLSADWVAANFSAVVGSPPCQFHTVLKHRYAENNHMDLIPETRALFRATGLPYIIENVEGARNELIDPIMLCGTMFPGLRVKRHRYFETGGFSIPQPEHVSAHPLHHTLDKRKPHYGKTDEMIDFVSVNGGGNCTVRAARDAYGVNHRTELTKHELNEGVPPAYSRFLGEHLHSEVARRSGGLAAA